MGPRPGVLLRLALIAGVLSMETVSLVGSSESSSVYRNRHPTLSQQTSSLIKESVATGILLGLSECQHQFRWDRWNCPSLSFPVLSRRHVRAVKEISFTQAVVSAGVTYTLTKNCSNGVFETCGCDNKIGKSAGSNWKWGGCGDNVKYGEMVAKEFLDNLETANDERAMVILHNFAAGRKAVRRNLQKTCKCHGISGSCSVKTCWLELPDFRQVGDYLKHKYRRAIKAAYSNANPVGRTNGRRSSPLYYSATVGSQRNGQKGSSRPHRGVMSSRVRRRQSSLLYLEESPDYCHPWKGLHTGGTLGRECSRPQNVTRDNQWERRSCRRLCKRCGYRVQESTVQVSVSCECKFQWCCKVQCSTCIRSVKMLTCQAPL